MRRGYASLGVANLLALLAAAVAAALYARWLDAPEFAHWAMALAVARASLLVLDGGLKTALVRRAGTPDAQTLSRLGRVCTWVALLLTAAIALTAWGLWRQARLGAAEALLLAVYPAAYLLTYPPLFAALARLERAQRFGPVGRAEGASVVLEFVLPAVAMTAGWTYAPAFAVAVVLARTLRSAWIVRAAQRLGVENVAAETVPTRLLFREGLGVQAVAALSMLRDQMHLWLLAPWFGAHWAGTYTLALTACALVSQASVQTASRVALPLLRAADPAARWPQVLAQTRVLALWTLPPLALLPAWLAHADAAWWNGRWPEAVAIAPWLAARMVAGVATTSLGAWLMVERSPWCSARAHAGWTACEIAAAVLALTLLGPAGQAVAGALTPWVGVLLFLAAATPRHTLWPRMSALVAVLLARPSLWLALVLALWAHAEPTWLPLATLALPLAWLGEPAVRQWLRRQLTRQFAPATQASAALAPHEPA